MTGPGTLLRKHLGRRAGYAAVALVLAAGVATSVGFNRLELRGVVVVPTAATEPDAMPSAAPVAEPESFANAFRAGISHLRNGDPHAAARAFDAARRANPHSAAAYVNLGFAYLEMGQPAASREVLERAIGLAPLTINAYYGLAEALDALGDREGAMGAMRTFVHLAPQDDPFRRRAMAALWEWEAPRVNAAKTAPSGPEGPPAATGAAAPLYEAALQTLDGTPTNLAAYRGRVIVLNVWATWCAPCRAELPSLDRLATELDPENFAVIGISIDRERAFTREFLADLEVRFSSYWDGTGKLSQGFLDARKIPLTVIIDPDGDILVGYEGARDWSAPALVSAIKGLAEQDMSFDRRVATLLEQLK